MPTEITYMNTSGNIATIFTKIRSAGAPPKFTHEFLKNNLGFTSSNDRGVIKILRELRFIDESSIPMARYHEYRDASKSGRAMAAGLREGWSDLFLSDEAAHERPVSELKPMFQSITGKGEAVALKMASTFKALCNLADFSTVEVSAQPLPQAEQEPSPESKPAAAAKEARLLGLHQDVHVHLPPTTDVAIYTAIFRALREELLD
jgi:hypothetical protein